jgi:site-specific DNA-methyltransferase (adenine-specific)
LIGLAADGWIVRNKIIWAKPNPMPVSVADRLNQTYEVVFFLVRSRRYFFDLDAIREPFVEDGTNDSVAKSKASLSRPATSSGHRMMGKNPGDVWTLPIQGYRGSHFATFPPGLLHRPLLATCPEAVCTGCGQPWRREVTIRRLGEVKPFERDRFVLKYPNRWRTVHQVGDLIPCGCDAPTRPGVVLDPFFGAGTVGLVAQQHGRDWLGIELNPDYIELAKTRLGLGDAAAA